MTSLDGSVKSYEELVHPPVCMLAQGRGHSERIMSIEHLPRSRGPKHFHTLSLFSLEKSLVVLILCTRELNLGKINR